LDGHGAKIVPEIRECVLEMLCEQRKRKRRNRARNSGMRARDVVQTAEEENAKIVPESRKLEVGSA